MKNDKWPLVANRQISEFLKKSILHNHVGGTYIFSGPDNLGKTTVAKFFAQIILCAHPQKKKNEIFPCGFCSSCKKFSLGTKTKKEQKNLSDIHGDFHLINREKDKKSISIGQIRDFIEVLNLSSFGGKYKIGIIKHAETLSNNAANALLKTLEEPKNKTIIILITKAVDLLPTTIVSRSQVLTFKPVKSDLIYDYLVNDLKIARKKARDISNLCLGRPALAMKFLENNEFYNFYNKKVEIILKIQNSNINDRFQAVDSLIDKKLKGPEAVRIAERILEIWQGIVRDSLLLSFGHNNFVQHIYLQDKIKINRNYQDLTKLLNLSKVLSSARASLRSNVNPHLIFDSIILNI